MEQLERFLLVSAFAIFIYVFYKWLLNYFRSKEIQGSFPYVFPFEEPIHSHVQLKLDLPKASSLQMSLLGEGRKVEKSWDEQALKAGVHEIDLDLSEVGKGQFELKLKFSNQTTTRIITIE